MEAIFEIRVCRSVCRLYFMSLSESFLLETAAEGLISLVCSCLSEIKVLVCDCVLPAVF